MPILHRAMLLGFGSAILLARPVFAADMSCRHNPEITGKCFTVWGTEDVYPDAGPMLNATAPRNETFVVQALYRDHPLPMNVEEAYRRAPAGAEVTGRFRVCPLKPQKYYKVVCVLSADNLKPVDRQRPGSN